MDGSGITHTAAGKGQLGIVPLFCGEIFAVQDYVASVQQFVVDALFGHSHACSVVSVHCSLGAFSNDHLLVFSLAVVHAVLGSLLAWLKHPSLVFSVAVDHAVLGSLLAWLKHPSLVFSVAVDHALLGFLGPFSNDHSLACFAVVAHADRGSPVAYLPA